MLTATIGSWYDYLNPRNWFTTEESSSGGTAVTTTQGGLLDIIMQAVKSAQEAQAAANVAPDATKAAAQAAADAAKQAAAAAQSAGTANDPNAALIASLAAEKARLEAEKLAGSQPFYKKPVFWGAVGGGVALLAVVSILRR